MICDSVGDDGKVNYSQLQRILDKYGIPHNYTKPIFKVLFQFELAVPLDADMLLLPSTIQSDPQKTIHSNVKYNFPGTEITVPKDILSGTINLHSTGVCYRRHFIANNIPEKFWFKLISEFVSLAEIFYNIFLNNCVEGMSFGKMASITDVAIGDYHCKYSYCKNSITLLFEDKVLFSINVLTQCKDTRDSTHGTVTISRLKNMQLISVNSRKLLFPKDGSGLEINVPDYVVHSSFIGKTFTSYKLGPGILAQVLEILNEVFIAFFNGDFDKGIYSQSYFSHVVICPYCCGDSCVDLEIPHSSDEITELPRTSLYSLMRERCESVSYTVENFDSVGGYGFDIHICIFEAQNENGFVSCPSHGNLSLIHLTPDLVSYDLDKCLCMCLIILTCL